MDSDRLERLMTQVLEETRAFRQETNDKLADAAQERQALRRDLGLVQSAVIELSKEVRRVEARLEAKLDATISNHGARLDKLEGAAE